MSEKEYWRTGAKYIPRDHSVIGVERGMQREIALKFDVGEGTVSRYLNGLYSDDSRNRIQLIRDIRAYARQLERGNTFYIVRDELDGKYRAFRNQPRRDRLQGVWFDPFERAHQAEVTHYEFPEEFLPSRTDMKFMDPPLKIQIIAIR